MYIFSYASPLQFLHAIVTNVTNTNKLILLMFRIIEGVVLFWAIDLKSLNLPTSSIDD